jgi:pyocin large subunit-like protein
MPPRNTKGFATAVERFAHFMDHAMDFSAATEFQYEEMADIFLTKPRTADMFECMRALGDRVRFDQITNEYGVIASNGVIRTYFIPKKCSALPKAVRRIKCHRFPTHLDYAKYTCSIY